ncbi:MAG: universal stress protein [Trueperaceae bacterium]|nr:universal stress protein [Trueperaceae bacterium]
MYARILIPTDGSACAMKAITEGLELARELGSEVTFLYALENPITTGVASPEALPYSVQLWHDLQALADEALDAAMRSAAEAGVAAKAVRVDDQAPVEAILAAEREHDLVVMGTHGRRGFNRWVFGSVSEGALRRASRPFLMIRSDAVSD